MSNQSPFRSLPSVDRVLNEPEIRELTARFSQPPVVAIVRSVLQQAREAARTGGAPSDLPAIIEAVVGQADRLFTPGPRPVINATGVIIHTNLGRAPLSL